MAEDKKEYLKQYYQKNKEQIKEQRKQFKEQNEEKCKACNRKRRKRYYETHKEEIKAWQQNNREKYIAYNKNYREKNAEKCKQTSIKRTKQRNNESRLVAHNHRQLWTPEEIVILEKMLAQGKTYKEIAERLGRTIAAVNGRITMLRKNGDSFNGNPVDI